MSNVDKFLICRDCGTEFAFTIGEQAFYAGRGFSDPTRCPACREARREAPHSGHTTALHAPRRPDRPLFPAVCASCGRDTMVPFEPRNGRPVYCRDCFQRLRPR